MRLSRHLNWVIAIALASAGVTIIRWPFLTLDTTSSAPTTAATLAGALFGAAALFAGAQINELVRHQETVADLQVQQRRLRAALDNEFVRVCVNLMQDASHLLLIRRSIMAPPQAPSHSMRFTEFEPLPTPVFEGLRSEILCLPENEIDVLCTFYGGLDATRRTIREIEVQAKTGGAALIIDKVLGNLRHDLQTAEEAARKIWPTRKIKLPREEAYVLADGLRNRADAVAQALTG